MHENALVRLPPEAVVNHLADWAIQRLRQWWPGCGSDLCEYVPCVYVDGDGEYKADLDDLDRDEAEERGWQVDNDPRWQGEEIGTDEVTSQDAYGKRKVVDVEVRVESDPMGGWLSGFYDRKQGPGGTLAIVFNWSRFDDVCSILKPGHWEDKTRPMRLVRAVVAHELTHAFGPHKVRLDELADPHDPYIAGLPWEREAWQKQYMTGPDERDAFARELFQRLKDMWLYVDDSWNGESYPFALQRQLLEDEDGEHLGLFLNALAPADKKQVVVDVGRGMRLFVRRQIRRRRLGRT